MSNWQRFASRPELDAALATHIANTLKSDIETRGRASLAVSGGSTPKAMFAALAQIELAWEQVFITLVDERWVAPEHDDSNERLVRENLLQGPAAKARFAGLKASPADANEGLAEVTARLGKFPLPFSCVVLGMGGDGHTASWFPQANNLAELLDPAGTAILGSCDPVTAPHQRITLTLPVVLAANEIVLHITGDEKATVLAEAAEQHYPIAAVSEQSTNPVSIWWAP
ncbi:6-phosphogluconolactonase [Halioglobus maricola]|uniref:6-phosphogluconolactonase n=1 Tax=Halioglobus maricola TaxID=2601894 RepID=A0A5P9NNP6_9GAMM|nr:6-phosphogluconolactonase [Halioglobus maricola]QFU77412.1 6-phosphogluconolactonase [Halioglobus maricola]